MKARSRNNARTWLALVLGTVAAYGATPAAAQSLSYPSRSSDLAADSFWGVERFDEGCCVLDFSVWRWDGNSWEKSTGTTQNSQYFAWDLPLYAPVSGDVISCWRNFPDDPAPGTNPPNNGSIFGGGNHVVILTDDDNVISINHFKSGTIPASICPANPDSTQFPSTTADDGDWRVAAYVEEGDRVRVTEGDYIGDAGSSGASSNPHLHMSIQPVTGVNASGREALGDPFPLPFRHGWAARFEQDEQPSAGSWFRLRGEGLEGDPACPTYVPDSPSCGFRHIHPSPYLRRTYDTAGDILGGDVLFISQNRVITATVSEDSVALTSGTLELKSWDLDGVTSWDELDDINGDEVKSVQLSEVAENYVMAALHTANDTLKMVVYHVGSNGTLTEMDTYSAGAIGELVATTANTPNAKMVTAVVISTGEMKLIAWDVVFPGGSVVEIDRLGEISTLGDATRLAIAPGRGFVGVYTALRNEDGDLMVIPWLLSNDGLTFTRETDVTSIAVGVNAKIAVAGLEDGVAVAMQSGSGNLHLRTWSVTGANIGSLQDTASAGAVSEIQLLTTPLGESNLTTVVRDGNGNMQLIGWGIDDDGDNIRRLGSSKTGAVSAIAADSVSRSYSPSDPRDMIATLARTTSNDDLLLIAWDTNLVNP